jgi:putative endonuclease
MYYVYVLYSEKDAGLYIGFTTDLRRRVEEHQAGLSRSTAYRGPFILAYYEAYFRREDAEGRERFLKSGSGRTYIKKQSKTFFAGHPLRVSEEK